MASGILTAQSIVRSSDVKTSPGRFALAASAWLVVSLVIAPSPAIATPGAAYVVNTSSGATGVQSRTHVLNRFPGREGYQAALRHASNVRPDGSNPRFLWEIYEVPNGSGAFTLWAHIYYESGQTGYPNDEYLWQSPSTVTGNAWHTLQLQQHVVNGSTWFDGYLDGAFVEDFWWPNTTGNQAYTGIETEDDLSASTYFFMGRHQSINLRTSLGRWSLQDSSWANRIQAVCVPSPYYLRYNSLYYDWEARRD